MQARSIIELILPCKHSPKYSLLSEDCFQVEQKAECCAGIKMYCLFININMRLVY